MGKIIGIDLGTSNSAAAFLEGGRPVIIPSAEGTTVGGGKAFPSYVAFTKDGQLIVGEPARRQAVSNPEGTVTAFKRKMGTDFKYTLHGKKYTPQQLSAFLLQKIKRDAEAFLGEKVEKAVITVPAYFNDNQRQATKDAGAIAGLEVVRIINEPTAACLAYGLDKAGKNQKILVFDLGGGTLDVTIMDFGDGVFEVLSTSGDTQLGGTDMDTALTDWIAAEFQKETGVDVRKDKMATAARARRGREGEDRALLDPRDPDQPPVPDRDGGGPEAPGPHAQPRRSSRSWSGRSSSGARRPVEQAIRDAKLSKDQIDRIVLVGGPTRMPIVQKFVETGDRATDRARGRPDGVRRAGRGHPGRRPRRRGQGRPAPRRHAAVARASRRWAGSSPSSSSATRRSRPGRARSSRPRRTTSPRSRSRSSRASGRSPPTTSRSAGSS